MRLSLLQSKLLGEELIHIGIYIGSSIDNEQDINELKNHLARIETDKPLWLVPLDFNTLTILLKNTFSYPIKFYYNDDILLNELREIKIKNNNFKIIKKTRDLDLRFDRLKKIFIMGYEIDSYEQHIINRLKIEIETIDPFEEIKNKSQKEVLIVPDSNGWTYNGSNGIWSKHWGNDGSQTINGW